MNGEGHDLLWELHGDDWLAYRMVECDAVLVRYGMELFELWEVDQSAVMLALNAGLSFPEWLEAITPPSRSKRL